MIRLFFPQVVNDLFAFLYADEVNFNRLQDVLEFMSLETDYSVWYAAIRGLNKLWHTYLGSETLVDIEVCIHEVSTIFAMYVFDSN